MRNVGKFYLGFTMVLAAGAANAQAPSSAEVNAAICKLTDCTATAAPVAAEDDDGSMIVGAQRSFSLSRGPAAVHAAAAEPARKPVRTASASPRARTAPVVATRRAPGKADMRVAFANGSAVLSDDAMAHVKIYAEALKSDLLAGVRFEIAGHTNSIGASDTNLTLSQRRAQAVVDYLIAQGVSPERLKASGFGANRPLDGHVSTDSANRRVEIVRVG